jgi:microcompartment protein CcmL/EutN
VNPPGSALGLLEVRGFVAALGAADAMAKTAPVAVRGPALAGDGLVTLAVHGEIAAVEEALAAGRLTAERLGGLVASTRIGRPEPGLDTTFGLG